MEKEGNNISTIQLIQKTFNQYNIKLIEFINSITIIIQQNNSFNIYESNFNLKYFHSFELFTSNHSINEIIQYISILILQKNVKIEENKENLIFILISNTSPNIELILLKKKINIKSNFNFINITSIQCHNDWITSVSSFPSGNLISVSSDQSIIIYDIFFKIIQHIKNAHDDSITYIEIKDENNFITCSDDKNIKLWIKINNEFIINHIIKKAHNKIIMKVINCVNGNLISCSLDKNIKIWKKNNNNYENIKTLNHLYWVNSILLLEDKNFLISSGVDGTKIWDLNNYYCIMYFEETFCGWNKGLCRLDEDKIIIGGNENGIMKIISIKEKKIIKTINNSFLCWCIYLIEDKGIFLVGGYNKDIKIYSNDNYECIQIIKKAHNDDISGFIELKNKTIASYSIDNTIKIWSN